MIRKFSRARRLLVALFFASWMTTTASANVFEMPTGQSSLQFVNVGDAGNRADTSGFGAVSYAYGIGRTEVTAGQYCQFLNAVARTDTYGLYDPDTTQIFGASPIYRSGTPGDFSYTVAGGHENFPVNSISWADAARFANWLNNGQPTTGAEDDATTEMGSYALHGATTDVELMAVTRLPSARYVIPTEDEWYKAAYYKGGSTNAGYWSYATQSDSLPSNIISSTGTNNANYFDYFGDGGNGTYSDPVNLYTPVGTFVSSPSAYGSFDQNGNVAEWNETNIEDLYRGIRGGSFGTFSSEMLSNARDSTYPSLAGWGFRVGIVPEPSSLSALAILCLMQMPRGRRGTSLFVRSKA